MTTFSVPDDSPLLNPGFTFGVATAAFQIEGAADQRERCIWDAFCEQPGAVMDGSNGLFACNHINRLDEDLDLIASLGVDAYRFSISWPRVIGSSGQINESGLDFYLRLIDGLQARNIKPYVTLYHWDLPLSLGELGGWQNRDTAYRFRDYVDAVTRRIGDRVGSYATLNEPFCSAYLGYEKGIHAPGVANLSAGRAAAHHLMLAHGLAVEPIRANAPAADCGIVLNLSPVYPASESTKDVEAAKLAEAYLFHWYLQPLLVGTYPQTAWNHLPADARPEIHHGDMALIHQTIDFLGINYYTGAVIEADLNEGFREVPPENTPVTDMGWAVHPEGLTDLLVDLKQRFSNLPPIVISENGAAFADEIIGGQINDAARVDYIQSHLLALHQAVKRGVRVDGYFLWSLMDNFEWAFGYQKRFGITYVDYQTQKRTVKNSGLAYREFLRSRGK